MGLGDKAKNKAEELKGDIKEKVSDVTDNESLQAEGAGEEAGAKTKQSGEHLKDAARDAGDVFRG